MVLLFSRTITCQSAAGARGAECSGASASMGRKTPHLAAGAGGALISLPNRKSVARYRMRARSLAPAPVFLFESCACPLPTPRGRATKRAPHRSSPVCRMLPNRSWVNAIIRVCGSKLRYKNKNRVADGRPTLLSASGEPASRNSVLQRLVTSGRDSQAAECMCGGEDRQPPNATWGGHRMRMSSTCVRRAQFEQLTTRREHVDTGTNGQTAHRELP